MKAIYIGQLLIFFTLSLSSFAGPAFNISLIEFNPNTCINDAKLVTSKLTKFKATDYQQLITDHGHGKLLTELWKTKILLHQKLREFYNEKSLVKECADAMRSVFFELRSSEDIIEDDLYRLKKDRIVFSDTAFNKKNPHVKRHPEFRNFDLIQDLKSGDIILSRGNAFTSAAISSLGEFDTQFSHMSMVYRDDDGKLWTVESHIEVGAFVRPIEEHIEDKNFRTMVFRFDDEYLAYEAAKFIYFKVKNASDTTGNINYDFAFNQESSTNLFCSEIASHAFDHVSNGRLNLPMFKSQLQARKPHFVKKLGIKAFASFIPSDIEVDPRFKLVAEWKNPSAIQDNLEKDAVLRSMYEWSDKYGYELIQGKGKAFVYRNVAWPLRRVPLLKKYFKDKLPINMSRELIGYFGVLESTGEILQTYLKRKEVESLKSSSFPLLLSEKKEVLEDFRFQELTSKTAKLHKMFRPSIK